MRNKTARVKIKPQSGLVTEVILGGGGVAGWGKHSEILTLPTKKEITENEAGRELMQVQQERG